MTKKSTNINRKEPPLLGAINVNAKKTEAKNGCLDKLVFAAFIIVGLLIIGILTYAGISIICSSHF